MGDVREPLAALAAATGRPTVLLAAPLAEAALVPLYDCLRALGPVRELDLVLVTAGGSITVARRMAQLLRDRADRLTVSVPYLARSAGTLLCLAADELVLGPMAELGPVDGQLGPDGPRPAGAPGLIAAEDVRNFAAMARDWFGVRREEDALQVLALVAQRVFPTTLTTFYRADRYVRTAAGELLARAVPDEAARRAAVAALVDGRGDHDDRIGRREAAALGLPVREPVDEDALWAVWPAVEAAREAGATGLVAGGGLLLTESAGWVGEGDRRQPALRWERQP